MNTITKVFLLITLHNCVQVSKVVHVNIAKRWPKLSELDVSICNKFIRWLMTDSPLHCSSTVSFTTVMLLLRWGPILTEGHQSASTQRQSRDDLSNESTSRRSKGSPLYLESRYRWDVRLLALGSAATSTVNKQLCVFLGRAASHNWVALIILNSIKIQYMW